eukprot:gene10822-12607_t
MALGRLKLTTHSSQVYEATLLGPIAADGPQYASRTTSGDINGKMLALPISSAGLVVLEKTTSRFEGFIFILGQAVVCAVLLEILHDQMLQTERLLHSFNTVLLLKTILPIAFSVLYVVPNFRSP